MISPRPLRHVIRKQQRPRGKPPVTVCIAASCEDGRIIVSATDGQLTYGDITADAMSGKMVWINEWQIMFAGDPANAQMIFQEVVRVAKDGSLTYENIRETISAAYKKRMADCLASSVLAPYAMTLDDFKREGLTTFGEKQFGRVMEALEYHAQQYGDQLLLTGWGESPLSAILYQIDPQQDRDHALAGISAIGSGASVALSTLLLLGQSRHTGFLETVYNVAAAKFSAEKSYNSDVGQSTAMNFAWKEPDEKNLICRWIQESEIKKIRAIWEEHGRPRFTDQARVELHDVMVKAGFQLGRYDGTQVMLSAVRQSLKDSKRFSQQSNPRKSEDQQ